MDTRVDERAHKDQLVRDLTAKAEAGNERHFITEFFAHVPPMDLAEMDVDAATAMTAEFWAFAQQRPDGTPKIRVRNPAYCRHTVIEIVNDDMPFLVDSLTAEINRLGLTVHEVIHPIVQVRRNSSGVFEDFEGRVEDASGGQAESWMHIQVDEQPDDGALESLEADMRRVLGDVRAVVDDWKPMLARLRQVTDLAGNVPAGIDREDAAEAQALLAWLSDNNFTLLGYRQYRVTGEGDRTAMSVIPGSGLGLMRDDDFHIFEGVHNQAELAPDVRAFLTLPLLLIVNKANVRSTVHRPVHMDAIAVKEFDDKGRVTGEHLFAGLFTSRTYTSDPLDIPVLRLKVQRIMERAGFARASHDAKALHHILATYPRDELFQIGREDLYRITMGILHLKERQRVALFARLDPFQRFVSCLVYVPREGYTTELRMRLARILEEDFKGEVTAFYTQLSDDSVLARLHFIVKTDPSAPPNQDVAATERRLAAAARNWSDLLREALVTQHAEADGLSLHRRYAGAFNAGYRFATEPEMAVHDIAKLEALRSESAPQMHMYAPPDHPVGAFHLRLYVPNEPMPISDALPVLENFGLRVIEELPHKVKLTETERAWIHDFHVQVKGRLGDNTTETVMALSADFADAFFRVWAGDMENDRLNALIFRAGLTGREVVAVRAYSRYLRQAGTPFSNVYLEETLNRNPGLVRLIVDLFLDHVSPGGGGRQDDLVAAINEGLEQVVSLDEDRIIRRFVNMVQATLRTNYLQTRADGTPKPWLSIKFASRRIDDLPLPRPMFEIWVYSPRVEGVHLRFGKVARGGLRWSDRPEDFRTEILGLVKAQVVKNAVIVPVGSKGGFVVKRPPTEGGRDAMRAEGIECYKMFIRGMLDLTDNIDGDAIVPPPDVVRHDVEEYGDDPYLVVAADKGTATFSDIANGVSEEYGFWLGDAFASGGSAGYDHKKMGITARGAWEAVKRHFREIGTNIQEEGFTTVGVGDMGGDVFGNGMLLSRHIRLVGAFNHLHIFVDPDPDAARSWVERKRLFDEAAGWDAYDIDLISEGGGVFSRSAKSVPVTPQMKSRFGIEADAVTPNELIRHLLRADVDLLWFGGIGTYVRSTGETDADAGDRANDALRITGRELRARVIGEGANLGMTQRGRIEYALGGGRLNTDSIDNSAGVDCSDHEVNIKILTGDVINRGDLDRKSRDALLEAMTDEVAALVLRDNYLQTQAISVTQSLGATVTDRLARFMRSLERADLLNRRVEFLPDDETLAERLQDKVGFTRPEISVLLSYAKIQLFDDLMASDVPDESWLVEDLYRYFPKAIRERYEEAIERHRLRREIIATYVTNSVINRAGISFVHDIARETGQAPPDICRAYLMARQAIGARQWWQVVEGQDNKIPAEAQIRALLTMGRLIKEATEWFLRHARRPLEIATGIATYGPGVEAFRANREAVLTAEQMRAWQLRREAHLAEGWPEAMADHMADEPLMISVLDLIRLTEIEGADGDLPLPAVGKVYFALGDRFALNWLRDEAITLHPDEYWDKLAVSAVIDDVYGHQFEMARKVLANGADPAGGSPAAGSTTESVIDAWSRGREPLIDQTQRLLEELRAANRIDVAMLAVANRQLRALAGS